MIVRNKRVTSEYTELEFIALSNTATCYINPDYTFTSNVCNMEITFSTTKTGKEMCLIGGGTAVELGFSATTGRFMVYASGKTTLAYTDLNELYDGKKHTGYLWQDATTKYLKVDKYDAISNNSLLALNGNKVYILTYALNNTSYTLQNGRFYRAKITDNGTLVRDLVPAMDSNNNLGAYDLVNGVFYALTTQTGASAGPIKSTRYKVMNTLENFDRLEYLQSSGTQYIDTEYVSKTNNCIVELDMAWTGTTVGDFESFAGFMADGTSPRNGLHKYSGYLMFGANVTQSSTTAPVSGERFIYKGDFTSGAQKMYKNGTQLTTSAQTYNFSSNTLPMYIFARNYGGANNYAKMRLYRARIYEGQLLVRDLIPAKNKKTNEIGLFDTVNRKFYTNKGTGSFTYNTITQLPSDYQRVDYIQSTGTQRIKLNINPTSKYKIEETFAITDRSVTSAIWCARGNNTGVNSTTAFYIANSSIRCDYGTNAAMTNIGNINANQIYTLTMDSEKWYLDGVLKTSMTAATFTSGSKLQLMASHYNGQDSNLGNYAKIRIYNFKVWDENRDLVGDFIPCYRKSDNIIGLYDVVGEAFYPNNGSGTFLKGDDMVERVVTIKAFCPRIIKLPSAYKQLEYIQATGTQYLEIGTKFNMDEGTAEITYQADTLSQNGMILANSSRSYFWFYFYQSGGNTINIYIDQGSQKRVGYKATDLDKHTMVWKNKTFYMDKVALGTDTRTLGTTSANLNICSYGGGGYCFKGKIFGCKIDNGQGLIRNLIPCERVSDGKPGMYDLVSRTFYVNKASSGNDFTKGDPNIEVI